MTASTIQKEYSLPRNKLESSRLNSQHNVWKSNIGYLINPKIASSLPVEARIADVGTGTGIWLTDLAGSTSPSCLLTGLDISDSQFPENHPPGCSFKVLNILEPVPEKLCGIFDMVHLRLLTMGLAGRDWQTCASNVMSLLKPGGWVQWEEADFPGMDVLQNVSGASRAACKKALQGVIEGYRVHGKLGGEARKLGEIVQAAGYEQCEEDVVGSDRVADCRTAFTVVNKGAAVGLLNFVAKDPGSGWTSDRVEELSRLCDEEIKDDKVYWRVDLHVAIGRKPGGQTV